MKKILALGNYTDAMYHGFAGVDEQLKKILGKDFEVVCTDDTKELLSLEKYDGFVCYLDIWESKLAEAEVQGILDFARSGGGILILHNGISIENDERLAALMGGKFTRHPPMEKLELNKIAARWLTKAVAQFSFSYNKKQ